MSPAPVNLWSLNNINIPGGIIENSRLQNSWGGVFYHTAFTSSAAKALNLNDAAIAIESHNQVVGAANLLYRPKLIFHPATIPLLFQYYGPILYPDGESELSAEFEECLSRHFDFAYLSIPPDIKISQFSKRWKIIPQKTPAILSNGLNSWGNGFRDDVKNKIRKAKREHIEITRGESFPAELWRQTFSHRKMPTPIPVDSLSDWCDDLIKASLLNIYLAKLENRIVAFRCELVFGGFAYDWLAGSDPEFHSTGANQFLMAEIGNEMASLNLRAWDLVGGQVGSIDDFKKSFGAEEIGYLHAIKAFNIKGRIFAMLRNLRNG
jgi:hypothetical protein